VPPLRTIARAELRLAAITCPVPASPHCCLPVALCCSVYALSSRRAAIALLSRGLALSAVMFCCGCLTIIIFVLQME